MDWLADESVDFRVIEALRNDGYNIRAIVEMDAGISDDQVLDLANAEQLILLTADKDFGELTYRLRKPHCGILLIRLSGIEIDKKIEMIISTISEYEKKIANNFAVLSLQSLRINTVK
ncbi:MAG: DUF5615 family PIN-like protein [Bacteroidota bacterium]